MITFTAPAFASGVPGEVAFYGHVTSGGSPCSGASITLHYNEADYSATTDSTGLYNIHTAFVSGASSRISATWLGATQSRDTLNYDTMVYMADFDFPAATPTPIPQVCFNWFVRHDGSPVAGALVKIIYGTLHETTAGSDGYYKIYIDYHDGQAAIWAAYTGLHASEQMRPTSPGSIVTTDIDMVDAVPSPSPSPSTAPTATATVHATAAPTPRLTSTPAPTPTAAPTVTAIINATASPVASTTPTTEANATGNATLTSGPTVGPTEGSNPTVASPAGGFPVTYLAVGLVLIVVVLAAAAYFVLRKKP